MNFITWILDLLRPQKNTPPELTSDELDISQREYLITQVKLEADLDKNITLIREALGNSMDLGMVRFLSGPRRFLQ